MRSLWVAGALCLAGLAFGRAPAAAQQPGQAQADTAAVLLATARRLADAGERDLATSLLRWISRHYGGTPAALDADQLASSWDRAGLSGNGRVQFIVANTLFGAWLGIVVPAAFGAESTAPFGAGLLVGPSGGLAASLGYTRSHPMSGGQATAYTTSLIWASWQAFGWHEVLDLGERQVCDPVGDFCFDTDSEEAPWRALAVGGLAGIAGGLLLSRLDIPAGDAAFVFDASLWGTWYGIVAGVLADQEGDALIATTLLGGNAVLLAAIPVARRLRPSVGQVRLATIVGLVGVLAGVGVDLLAEVDDEKVAVALPAMGSIVGLGVGWTLGAGRGSRTAGAEPGAAAALFEWNDHVRGGLPLPRPTPVRRAGPGGRVITEPGIALPLFTLRF